MMAYNPYLNNPYASMYGQGAGYVPQQQFQPFQQAQPPMQGQTPRSNVQYAAEDEIKAYVLMPNTQMLALDKEKPIFYIKTADGAGRSTLVVYEYKKVGDAPVARADTVEYATKSDLAEYATKQDIAELRSIIESGKVKEEPTDEH